MATRQAPPSRTSAPRSSTRRQSRVDVREWLGGIRLSGFMVIMLGLVVLAVFVLVPTVSTYVGQQQQIAALEHSVQVTKGQIADLERERARWKDPAYITTEARERLYYVKPGEVVYLIDDDLPASQTPQEKAPVSKTVQQTHTDWMSQLVRSVTSAGMAKTATDTPAPSTTTPTAPGTATTTTRP
jgi:cell division protein FtsB